MNTGTLTIFSASAGSGKTYNLAKEYLKTVFSSRNSFRHVLAVTFTNKATAEMKNRILEQLYFISTGKSEEYTKVLVRHTGKSEEWIRTEARNILNAILNDYSRFSVSTIDSFFQKILRAFARESGIRHGYNIRIDHAYTLSRAVDEVIASASKDKTMLRWLTNYVKHRLDEEKDWYLKNEILKLAEELFSEKYRILSFSTDENTVNKEFLEEYLSDLKTFADNFERKLNEYGNKCMDLWNEFGLSEEMFYQKGKGIPSFIKSLVNAEIKEPPKAAREIFSNPPRWSTGPADKRLTSALNAGMDTLIKEAINYFDANFRSYKTVKVVEANIYTLGIMSDISWHVHRLVEEENSFLLSDTGDIIFRITNGDQTPFIYEKTGNRFNSFMIDEFQDTSIIQWHNFSQLIENSMAEGFDNILVGDIKQSIYRWRNSDWRILYDLQNRRIDNKRYFLTPLRNNWRSRNNLIRFNNTLFRKLPGIIEQEFAQTPDDYTFSRIYSDVQQEDPGKHTGGYIRIEFLDNNDEFKWYDSVLQKLPSLIELVQDKGYKCSDIGIIVRTNREGADVLRTIVEYSNKCGEEKRSKYEFNVLSDDSLWLSASPVINFIMSVLYVLRNPEDIIKRAEMLRFFLLATENKNIENLNPDSDSLEELASDFFPEGYDSFMQSLREMPVFEMTENIIEFFELGKEEGNIPYLQSFQDHVLGLSASQNCDPGSFIDWWEEEGCKKSLVFPGNQNAIRILTIHKAKGLEFKVVILPFLAWAMDHEPNKQPVLWVKPDHPPFNKAGLLPVRYKKDLEGTIFQNQWLNERFSIYLDNLNLLYVALTRAKDAILGFAPLSTRKKTIADMLLKSLSQADQSVGNQTEIDLPSFFKREINVFEYGELPAPQVEEQAGQNKSIVSGYPVSNKFDQFGIKYHSDDYFILPDSPAKAKISYGRLMHEAFELIMKPEDVRNAVMKLAVEGKISGNEINDLENKIKSKISAPIVSDWFRPDNLVYNEADILLPGGTVRRPDRVIFRDGKVTVIDFKFGNEQDIHKTQIKEYCNLLTEMGYEKPEAFIWYVEINRIVTV